MGLPARFREHQDGVGWHGTVRVGNLGLTTSPQWEGHVSIGQGRRSSKDCSNTTPSGLGHGGKFNYTFYRMPNAKGRVAGWDAGGLLPDSHSCSRRPQRINAHRALRDVGRPAAATSSRRERQTGPPKPSGRSWFQLPPQLQERRGPAERSPHAVSRRDLRVGAWEFSATRFVGSRTTCTRRCGSPTPALCVRGTRRVGAYATRPPTARPSAYMRPAATRATRKQDSRAVGPRRLQGAGEGMGGTRSSSSSTRSSGSGPSLAQEVSHKTGLLN